MDGEVNLGAFSSGPGSAAYDSTGTYDVDIASLEVYQNVIVVEPEREEVSKGGIVIADVGQAQKVRWGRIVACGPGRYEDGVFVATTSKVGDRVMFGKYQSAGEPIKIGGREYLLFREGDLIARIRS
jgi:chaperonin GroES